MIPLCLQRLTELVALARAMAVHRQLRRRLWAGRRAISERLFTRGYYMDSTGRVWSFIFESSLLPYIDWEAWEVAVHRFTWDFGWVFDEGHSTWDN